MSVEIRKNVLRIRIRNPKNFETLRIHVLSDRLHRIAGIYKRTKKWETQAWRIKLSNYYRDEDIFKDLAKLFTRKEISENQYRKAKRLVRAWLVQLFSEKMIRKSDKH